jgi:DNA-binding NarL/FixJ family response regulator
MRIAEKTRNQLSLIFCYPIARAFRFLTLSSLTQKSERSQFLRCPIMNNGSKLSLQVEDRSLSQSSISISIISNSGLMSEALEVLLGVHQSIHLVGSYRGNVEVTEAMPNPLDHIVLIDSGIGSELTVTRIQQLRRFGSPPYAVVLELENNIDMILTCIEAGANGYTLQGASSEEVNQVILQARQGIAQCSPEITAKLFTRLADLRKTQHPTANNHLSSREMEVLRLIAKGYSDRAIALDLVIEICTVKHHVHKILHKLAVKHRWDAVRLATNQGWIT